MSKLLVLCGKKQSGKSSTAKFLYGREMVRLGLIETFNFNEDAELLIPSDKTESGWGIFDIYNKDYEFVQYANQNVWPHVKVFSFADKLKLACNQLFGIPLDLMYGSDEDKATPTNIHRGWAGDTDEQLFYTVRQLLQDFGTKCREIDPDCFASRVCDKVVEEQRALSVVDDCRYPNELTRVDELNAVTIKFTRQLEGVDLHSSETALDDLPDDAFDFVVDNKNMTLTEKNEAVEDVLLEVGILLPIER